MAKTTELRVLDKLLISAWLVAGGDTEAPIPFARLCVTAARRFPEAFGLDDAGTIHPHTNRVQAELSHQESIVKKHRWLRIAGVRTWKLTAAGAKRGRKLYEATR